MSNSQANIDPRPSRLQLIKERGADAIPAIPKRGAQMLPLTSLVEDPNNERKTFQNMEGLIDTVKAIGVIEPLTVIPYDDEKYMIITGHRRFRAAKAAGLQNIRVVISDPEEDHTRRRMSIISNVQREDVPPIELAEALQSLLDEDAGVKTQRELATLIGKRESWVSDMLRILTLPPKLQQELRSSEVSVPYDAVMRVSRVAEPAAQRSLIKDIVKGKSNREIREKIKQVKEQGTSPQRIPHASHKIDTRTATVVIRFNKANPSKEDIVQVLKDALVSLES